LKILEKINNPPKKTRDFDVLDKIAEENDLKKNQKKKYVKFFFLIFLI